MTPATYLEAIEAEYARLGARLDLGQPLPDADHKALLDSLDFRVADWLVDLWQAGDGGPSYSPVFTRPNYFTGADFLSLREALDLRESLQSIAGNFSGWREERARDRRVRTGWFLDGWMPFASFGVSTIVLFADCDPAPGGKVGQVISYVHDPDQITLLAPDGETYLAASLAWFREQAEEFVPEA